MDRAQLRDLAHVGLPFNSPVTEGEVARLLVGAPERPRVLDLGCGDGRMLDWVVRRTSGSGVGVDSAPGAIPGLDLRVGDMLTFDEAGFDLVMCVGALPTPREAALRGFHRHAPRLLFGELYRTRPVHGPLVEVPDLAAIKRALDGAGWVAVDSWEVEPGAMAAYERHWVDTVQAWADTNDHDGARRILADRKRWMTPDVLGFHLGVYEAAAD